MTLEQPFKDNANLPDPAQVGAGTVASVVCWGSTPSQDNADQPVQHRSQANIAPLHPPADPLLLQGWSPERSMRLGGSMLDAVLAVAPKLR